MSACGRALLFSLAVAATAWAGDKKHLFEIRVAPPTDPEAVQVRYLLTGDFGGAGGFQVQTGDHEIAIRLDQTSKTPKGLRAVLYAPGCEIALVRVDDLKSERMSDFTCRPLPSLDVIGEFPRPPALKGYQLQIEVSYQAIWSHEFFGIRDGATVTIPVATAPAGPDGSFRFQLPDFTKDPLYSSLGKQASLVLWVRERNSGNVVAELRGPTSAADEAGMRIQGNYPNPLMFTYVPAR